MLDGKVITDLRDIPLYKLELGTHTFTVKAMDGAGNTSTQSVDFQVKTSFASLEELVQRFAGEGAINNQGIANSLLKIAKTKPEQFHFRSPCTKRETYLHRDCGIFDT